MDPVNKPFQDFFSGFPCAFRNELLFGHGRSHSDSCDVWSWEHIVNGMEQMTGDVSDLGWVSCLHEGNEIVNIYLE